MVSKLNILLFFVITFQILYLSFAEDVEERSSRKKKPPRTYGVEYPDVRKGNTTLRPIEKPKHGLSVSDDLIPMSRVGLSGVIFPDELQNAGKKSNTRHSLKNKRKDKPKRVIRETNDVRSECINCLDDKLLKHYYAKGCKAVEMINSQFYCNKSCPKYFECPKLETNSSIRGCEYKGVIYKVGEEIPNPNECLHCQCSGYTDSEAYINCAVSECFGDWRPMNESCYKSYEDRMCCSRHKCFADITEMIKKVKTCLYGGKSFKEGERIYPKEDNCLSCICDEKWNASDPISSPSCIRNECDFEIENKWNKKQDCVPIYNEDHCCPYDYHCPEPKEWKCLFGGKTYDIGEKLVTKSDCVECICRVPPDFTCIHRKCDPKPVDSDCTSVYEKNKCCPTYNCTNETNESKRMNKMLLNVETPKSEGELVANQCPLFIAGGLACAGTNCTTIIDSNGCQACECEKSCPQIECINPCYLFLVTPGECPQCKCP